jgi:hypothetical protein
MKIKTHELIGPQLDWAVASALNQQWKEDRVIKICQREPGTPFWIERENHPGSAPHFHRFCPSIDRLYGMEIVEREGIAWRKHTGSGNWYAMLSKDVGNGTITHWDEMTVRGGERYGPQSYAVHKRRQRFVGETPLIASMRCYVASILGAEVDVPDELAEAA